MPTGALETKVSDFIDDATKMWNMGLLFENFNEEDVRYIASIPVSKLSRPDCIMWHYENNGVYSVRSAYRMLMTNGSVHCDGTQHNDGLLWGKIWKIQIPNKIKVFFMEGPETIPHALHGRVMARQNGFFMG
ncbi:hypothetical protein PTKIN_Ptkin04bG0081000 [Pterospermum kingtungense]